jgi:hypothetical protein
VLAAVALSVALAGVELQVLPEVRTQAVVEDQVLKVARQVELADQELSFSVT